MESSKDYLKPFLLVLFGFILVFAYSKFGPSLPLQILTQEKGLPLVVSAEGKSVFTPNEATINLGVQDSGKDLLLAQAAVNSRSKKVLDMLKNMGIKEEDIKTTSYNASPQLDYGSPEPLISGYNITINYDVKVKDLAKVNSILGQATANGANLVGGVSFDADDATKLVETNKAREEAVKNAKDKAQGLAKAAGITLGKLINISEDQSSLRPVPFAQNVSLDSKTTTSNPQVQPGTNEVDLTVTLTYEIR